MTKIVCLSNSGDTVLVETYSKDLTDGYSTRYYESGEVMEVGPYQRNYPIDIWKRFYKTGELKSYRYYKQLADSIALFYEKTYTPDGTLNRMMLPIEYRTVPKEESSFLVGTNYDLYIDLLYSEYDSVNSMVLIDSSPSSGVEADTVYYTGRSGLINFTPKEEGSHSITGTYIEVDGNDSNPDESTVAEKPFKFDYFATR